MGNATTAMPVCSVPLIARPTVIDMDFKGSSIAATEAFLGMSHSVSVRCKACESRAVSVAVLAGNDVTGSGVGRRNFAIEARPPVATIHRRGTVSRNPGASAAAMIAIPLIV